MKKILLVDDERNVHYSLQRVLGITRNVLRHRMKQFGLL
jgi:DNA-binding protein Fis